jgi:phosphate transport system substrate-binding protein
MENNENTPNIPKESSLKKYIVLFAKAVLFIIALVIMFFVWVYCSILISISSVKAPILIILLTLLFLSVIPYIYSNIFYLEKKFWKYPFILSGVAILGLITIPTYRYLTVDRYPKFNNKINWYNYAPWSVNTKVVKVTANKKFHITSNLPKIDGAYALYPVYSGVVRALYNRETFEKKSYTYLSTNGSDITFKNLLDNDVDLIFSAPPSKQQILDAKKKSLTYEIIPFAKEAFVFFVNKKNPINNLSSEQIRQIYSGKITNWSQIDKNFSGKIKPFQRNAGSGSQTMLEKIMKDTPIIKPLKEDRLRDMGGIINDVAMYRNYQDAIGFSFRFFASEMFNNKEIKLLSIDGIAPTVENIRNKSYPFIADCCVITVKKRNENIQKIVDFLFSKEGKTLINQTGYVSLEK